MSIAGLVREAALEALADAEMTWADIDAVVIGKAPDFFEGVMMPELYLADALGAVGKPMLRVHTAGSVGGSTALVAASLVQAGIHERVLTVAFEKQSESEAMWALTLPIPFQPPLVAGAGGYFAPHIRAYMRRSGAPDHIGVLVALKDRLNALKNPKAHLHEHDISFESVQGLDDAVGPDPLLRDVPVVRRRLRHGPHRRGRRRRRRRAGRRRRGCSAAPCAPSRRCSPGRDQVNPQGGRDCAADVYAQAGITDPRRDIDVAEVYVPFSWYEPMWLENLGFAEEGKGWKLVEDGATAMDGDIPWNRSGGVLSSNPIGASGMIRFAEAAMQVRGQAGEHQIDGARRSARPRLRRRLAVLRHVGRRRRQALGRGRKLDGTARRQGRDHHRRRPAARARPRPACSRPRAPGWCSPTCSTTRATAVAAEIGSTPPPTPTSTSPTRPSGPPPSP